MDNIMIALHGPVEIAQTLAARSEDLRLLMKWTRNTLAQRAGISSHSLKRFETTGKASLELVLKIAHVFARLEEFSQIFRPPPAQSMEELEQRSLAPPRKRGSI